MRHISKLLVMFCGAILVVVAGGCLRAGVGDPATAQIDPQLIGVWGEPSSRDLVLVKAWDSHTYAITELNPASNEVASGPRKVTIGRCSKAWLARIGDATFLTLETTPQDVQPNERPFYVAKIEASSDRVVLHNLNLEFVQDFKTAAELQQFLCENLENPKLFVPNEAIYTRVEPLTIVER